MKRKAVFLLLLVLLFVTTACSGQEFAETSLLEKAYQETGMLLAETTTPQVGSVGGEWLVIGLARSRQLSDATKQNYLANAEEYVQGVGSDRLHPVKSTDNARVILGVTAAGGDPHNVGGYDLIAGLNEMSYLRMQGLNGPIWALIALDCGGYEPVGDVTRKGLIQEIISEQCKNGGWGLSSNAADIDITAMAVQALAPYQDDAAVKAATDKALRFLSDQQQEDGGYASYGSVNSESVSQVIVALTSLGADPTADIRFIKHDNTLLDALLLFAVDGGGFCHTLDTSEINGMASEQAYYALVSYHRFQNDETRLYDMA